MADEDIPASEDLGALISDSRAAVAAAAKEAAPAPAPAPEPEKVSPAPVEPEPAPPTPAEEPPAPPDQGSTPKEAAPPATPTPADTNIQAFYELAGIDSSDAEAPAKLRAWMEERRAAPTPAAGKPPAAPKEAEPPVTVESLVEEFAAHDELCLQAAKTVQTESTAEKSANEKLQGIEAEIEKLDRFLAPIKVDDELVREEPDEYKAAIANQKLTKLRLEAFKLTREIDTHHAKAEQAREYYWRRRDSVESEFQGRLETERTIQAGAVQFEQEWRASFDAEFRASGLPAEDRDETLRVVKREARLQMEEWKRAGKLEVFTDQRGYIKGVLDREKARDERRYRARQADNARGKKLDSAVPAPPPAVAPGTSPGAAPAQAHEETDPEAILAASFRAARQAKAARRG